MSTDHSQPAFRFARELVVPATAIDELHHANNVEYVRWVQDTAAAHWLAAIPEDEREQYSWVVREHHLRYHRPALLHDRLRCTTWIGEIRGAQCRRFVRIERAADNVVLCEAETQWVLLDPATQRPKRVEAEIKRRLWEPVG